MAGTYQVETDGDERFNIAIPAFSLDLPNAPRTIK